MIFKTLKLAALLALAGISANAQAHFGPGGPYRGPYHGPYYSPGYNPGYWPGYYPGYAFTCFAQNNFGQVFYGVSPDVYAAQNIAAQYCYYSGGYCVLLGCR
jgi:hypothetical protein